jgi:hypothetical protein
MAWALSVVLAVSLTTVTVLWKTGEPPSAPVPRVETVVAEPNTELTEAGPQKSLFDEVGALGEEQQELLRRMLESEMNAPLHQQ